MMVDDDKSMVDEPIQGDKNKPHKIKLSKKYKGFLIAFESLAVLLLIVAGFMGYATWRLTQGPVDITFAKSSIQGALADPVRGVHVDFDRAVLSWPDLDGPLLVGLENGRVYNDEQQLIVGVARAGVALNKGMLLLGRISPEGLIIKSPAILLRRDADNGLSIGLQSNKEADVEDVPADKPAQTVSLENVFGVFDDAGNSDAGMLSRLKRVRIENARLVIDDAVLGRSWAVPRMNFRLLREDQGMRMVYDIDLPDMSMEHGAVEQGEVPNLEGDAVLDGETRALRVDSVLSHFDVDFLGDIMPDIKAIQGSGFVVDAAVKVDLASDLSLQAADVSVFSKGGALPLDGVYDAPLQGRNLGLTAHYDAQARQLDISSLTAQVQDIDVKVAAKVTHGEGGYMDALSVSGAADIPAVTHDQIAALWPAALDGDVTKEWIVDKISRGDFSDVHADFSLSTARAEGGGDDQAMSVSLDDLTARLQFSDFDMAFKQGLNPVVNGVGEVRFDYASEALRVDVAQGQILDLDVGGSELAFDNIITAGAGFADLKIALKGNLQSLLRFIGQEPIGVDAGFDLDAVKGQVSANVGIAFPTRDDILMEDIKLDVKGQIVEGHLPDVLSGLALTGGPFDVKIDGNTLAVAGTGALDGRAIDVGYQQFLKSAGQDYDYKVQAKLTADEALRAHLGIDLSDFLSGDAPIDVDYTKRNDGSAQADVKVDITPARFFLQPLHYDKPVGETGSAQLTAKLKNDNLVSVENLTLNAPNAVLDTSKLLFRQRKGGAQGQVELASGAISHVVVGETDGKLDFAIAPSGLVKLVIDAKFLDLRPFLHSDNPNEEDAEDGIAMQISVDAAKIRTSDTVVIDAGKAFIDMNKDGHFNQMELDATVGRGDLYVRYKPDENGMRSFRLEADDAGATLNAFGLYDAMTGGKIVIRGAPKTEEFDRNLMGRAEITNFKIVKAPTMAKLISLMSLSAPLDLLNNQGIGFDRLDVDFEWLFNPKGSSVVFKNGRTSGNSLGFTFAGAYNTGNNAMNVNGTIIPLSGVNNILQDIPLVGNILGGKSGLIAATYKITGDGSTAEPKVSVNPLSVLAPGIFRSILFEDSRDPAR